MLHPKKSLGQNFLIDKNIINKIISLKNIKNRNILEIGPGQGALTEKILEKKPKSLLLIEKGNPYAFRHNFFKGIRLGIFDGFQYDFS